LISPEGKKEILKQEFLGNAAFQRFADALLLYYDMIRASEGLQSENFKKSEVPSKEELKTRMDEIKDLFSITLLAGAGKKILGVEVGIVEGLYENTDMLLDSILDRINNSWGDMDVPRPHNEKIDRDTIVDYLVGSKNFERYLRSFKRQTMEKPSEGIKRINEVVNYHVMNPETVSIHLAVTPTNMEISRLLDLLRSGFIQISQKFKGTKVNQVAMASWLFAPQFFELLKQIFPKGDLPVEEYKSQDLATFAMDTADVERHALVYNKKMLKDYLLTGNRPGVYKVDMSMDDFAKSLD